ncbi:MAG: hypothetical protein ACRCXK_02015 [Wohlfahrtiimonas sp.]
MITLTDKNGKQIRLNDHLIWVNWGQYSPIEQNQEYTLDGSLVIEATEKKAGMPITLSAAPNQGLKYRKDVGPIKQMMLANIHDPMTLKMHDESTYQVLFSSLDGVPIESVPLVGYADPSGDDYIGLTLRFIEVE